MKSILLLTVLAAALAGCGTGDAVPSGQWEGRIGGFEVHADITGDTTFTGRFTLPAVNEELTAPVLVRGDSVLISLPTESMGTLVLAGLYEDTLIGGSFILEGAERQFFLKRSE